MSQALLRRVRSLEILDDLQRLAELGMPVQKTADKNHALMLEGYRYNARIGEFDHLRQFVDPQAISVDIGANRGQYALTLAAQSSQCIVIEPIQALAWLAQTLPPNCLFFNLAAGAADGQGTLSIPLIEGRPEFALATFGSYYADQETRNQETPVRALDSLLQECCPDERVGFVKIDVEGEETAVIQGAVQTLARWRPNIQVEIWQDRVPRTAAMFAELGYRGIFFFDGRLFDIGRFDPALHAAPENGIELSEQYDPNRFINNFFFIPA